jgi:hypothetical protein
VWCSTSVGSMTADLQCFAPTERVGSGDRRGETAESCRRRSGSPIGGGCHLRTHKRAKNDALLALFGLHNPARR